MTGTQSSAEVRAGELARAAWRRLDESTDATEREYWFGVWSEHRQREQVYAARRMVREVQ